MSEIGNLYDNGPISPIARIKDTISVYTAKKWSHYQIAYIEPWPRSRPLIVEMVALSGAVIIPANGAIAKRLVPILQVSDGEMLHVRFEPLDDVEGVVWEQSGTGKFNSRNTHARVSMVTGLRDPYLATTTFFILGLSRDMNLEAQNPNPVALNQARFQFFGYRFVLDTLSPDLSKYTEPQKNEILTKLANGDKETVAQFIGPTTWIPAEGR